MNSRDILIWLNSIKGVGNITIDKLDNYFGDLSLIWEVPSDNIRMIKGVSNKVKEDIIRLRNKEYFNKVMNKINKSKVNIITILDDNYPDRLRNIYSAPKVLHVKGNLLEEDKLAIAIVGSRKATYYGKWAAEKFAIELASMGITIISGMAKGIDTKAHSGALSAGGRTISVLGCGVDIVYPKSNKNLYNNISDNGAIISEYPLGMEPLAQNFPQRNRIISALSIGVIVIEAKEKSGSLITAGHALEQGVEVFALPGNINSIYSKGTNLLIKDGAKMVTELDDIIEEISILKDKYKSVKNETINYEGLSEKEIKIVQCISSGPIHCDMISYNTDINISELNSILTILEMKGLIKQLQGKIFTIK